MAQEITKIVYSYNAVGQVKVVRAWRSINAQQNAATRSLSSFNRQAKRVIGATIAFAMFAKTMQLISKAVSGLITVPAQFELIEAQLMRLSSSAEQAASDISFLIKESLATPFELEEIMQATVTLKAFGLDAQRYLPVVLDWASGMNMELSRMATAFGKVHTGSKQISRILATRGIAMRDFNKQLGESGDRAAALADIIEKRFGGMRIIMADTFKGIMSNVREAIAFIQRTLGLELFDLVKMRISQIFDFLLELFFENEEALKKWADKILTLGISIDTLMRYAWNGIKNVVDALNRLNTNLSVMLGDSGAFTLLSTALLIIGRRALVLGIAFAAIQDVVSGIALVAMDSLLARLGQLMAINWGTQSQIDAWRKLADEYAEQVEQGSRVVAFIEGLTKFMEQAAKGFGDFRAEVERTREELLLWLGVQKPFEIGVEAERSIITWIDALEAWATKTREFLRYEFWTGAINRMMNAFVSGFQRMTIAIIKSSRNIGEAIKNFFVGVVDAIIAELARLAALKILWWILGMAGLTPPPELLKPFTANPTLASIPSGGMGGGGMVPAPAGPSYNFYGPIYGFDDFKRKVDEANREISRGRV